MAEDQTTDTTVTVTEVEVHEVGPHADDLNHTPEQSIDGNAAEEGMPEPSQDPDWNPAAPEVKAELDPAAVSE